MAPSHHPTFCGPKNENYLSGFDVRGSRWSRFDRRASERLCALSSEGVNDKKPDLSEDSLRAASAPGIMSPSAARRRQTQVQGLGSSGPGLQGADSSFYLPISLWILLQYWQTDSPALWGGTDPLRQQVIISN